MCGLVGLVGANLNTLHAEAFKWLLHLDVIRGEDSTGIALRRSFTNKQNRSQVIVAQTEGHPSNLIRKFPELFDGKGVLHNRVTERFDFLMGHNRAATVGAVNSTNAHPFHHGYITGCHNGTIQYGLTQLPNSPEIAGHTDSEKLIYALSQGWSIKKVMDTVTGAAAMTWWDSNKKTFNIYKNKERPLFLTHNDAKTVYAYASEEWLLRIALNRAKLGEMTKNIKEFTTDNHMEIVLGDNKIEEVRNTVIAPLVTKTTTTPNYGATVIYPRNNRREVKLLAHEKPDWFKKEEVTSKKHEPFRASSGWVDLSDITEEDFNYRARYGCAMCQVDLEFEDHKEGFVKWMEKDVPLCKTCSNEFNEAA